MEVYTVKLYDWTSFRSFSETGRGTWVGKGRGGSESQEESVSCPTSKREFKRIDQF